MSLQNIVTVITLFIYFCLSVRLCTLNLETAASCNDFNAVFTNVLRYVPGFLIKPNSAYIAPERDFTFWNASMLEGIVHENINHPADNDWGEHFFGDCVTGPRRALFQFNHTDYLLTRVFVSRRTDCVYIRTTTPQIEEIRLRPLRYSFCFIRVIYCKTSDAYVTRYYEFYKPANTINITYQITGFMKLKGKVFATPPKIPPHMGELSL